MLGERSDQRGLWEAGQLFRDADVVDLYCPDNNLSSD